MRTVQKQTSHHPQSSLPGISERLRVELIDQPERLAQLAERWDRLMLASAHPLPMLTHAWVAAHLNYQLDDHTPWFCLVAWEDDRLIGALPLVRCGARVMGIPLARLCTPHEPHTRSVDLVAAPHDYVAVLQLFNDYLDAAHNRSWMIDFNQLSERSPLVPLVTSGRSSYRSLARPNGRGAYLPVAGTFEDYQATLGHYFRRNLRRAGDRLARNLSVEYEFLRGLRITLPHLERFLALEDSGWKHDTGGSIRLSPSLTYFYQQITEALAKRGWLEFHFLRANGALIAAQMAVRLNRELIILRIAYDERYAAYSPGNLLFQETVRRCHEEYDIAEINCLTDMPWHANWRMQYRQYYDVSLYGRAMWPYVKEYLPRKTQSTIKKMPGRLSGQNFAQRLLATVRKMPLGASIVRH